MGIKYFKGLGVQSRQSLRSGRRMVPPRPCRDQAVPPNWMTSKEETDQRGHQETNGNFKRATGLYGKDWSLCAFDKNIPNTPSLTCMVGWQEGSHYSKKAHLESRLRYAKTTPDILKSCGKKFCGLTKPRWNFLAEMQNVTFGANPTQHITLRTPSLL